MRICREHRWLIFPIISLLTVGCGKFTVANILDGSQSEPHGRLLWSATAKLLPQGELSGGGFLEMNVYDDGTALPSVRIKLPPPYNIHYEAWLTNDGRTAFNNLGPLVEKSQGTYYLRPTTIIVDDTFIPYTAVLISGEPMGKSAGKPTNPLLVEILKITAINQ